MKLAITLSGDKITDKIDHHFGRCKYFCIHDPDENISMFIENKFAGNKDGVGRNVVELIVKHQVNLVISREFGQKVKLLLEKHKIQMVRIHDESITGDKVLQKIQKK
jgi:predicted Fe-Mo cluster-binding NifX family protein